MGRKTQQYLKIQVKNKSMKKDYLLINHNNSKVSKSFFEAFGNKKSVTLEELFKKMGKAFSASKIDDTRLTSESSKSFNDNNCFYPVRENGKISKSDVYYLKKEPI